ncbi:MAG: hypothetical protein PHP22_09740 [Oscillospiraceae bacterium]|nr:hypothetical protein [Oscillospiraceae bacterium]
MKDKWNRLLLPLLLLLLPVPAAQLIAILGIPDPWADKKCSNFR